MPTYVLGATNDDCECDPCACDSDPNCDPTESKDLEFFDDSKCCYGPWDTYVKENEEWTLDHTLYCLADVYDYYAQTSKEYMVVLTGKPVDWDPVLDSSVPECWFQIDPYSANS